MPVRQMSEWVREYLLPSQMSRVHSWHTKVETIDFYK